MYLLMTAAASGHSLSTSGNHQFFPILLAFQFSEFPHMVHNQIVRSTAQLTFLSFQPVYKACGADAGHWIRASVNRPLYIGEDIERTAKFADPVNPRSHQQHEE